MSPFKTLPTPSVCKHRLHKVLELRRRHEAGRNLHRTTLNKGHRGGGSHYPERRRYVVELLHVGLHEIGDVSIPLADLPKDGVKHLAVGACLPEEHHKGDLAPHDRVPQLSLARHHVARSVVQLATPRSPLPASELKRLLPQKPINVVHGD